MHVIKSQTLVGTLVQVTFMYHYINMPYFQPKKEGKRGDEGQVKEWNHLDGGIPYTLGAKPAARIQACKAATNN
jgi:hypothetical protein